MATITVPSDPTLPVAGAEIKAPPLKDWITNIRTFIESTSIDEANVDTSGTDGIVGKSIAQTVTGLKTWSNVSAAAGGLREVAKFEINPASGTPAANDGLRMTFTADDAGGAATAIGYLDLKMTDASASSEDSEWRLSTIANASSVTPLVVNSTAITMTTTTVAIGTNATVGGALTVTGGGTFGSLTVGSAAISEAELEMLDGITPGTIAASKAVVVNSNKDASDFRDVGARNIVLTGELDAVTLDISGDADIDGTTNLDAVDIDGAVQIDSTVSVGVDDQGYDVKFFGDTASAYLLWDTSADKLLTAGGAVVDIVKDKLLIGGTAVTTTAAELNILDGVTSTTAELNILDGVTSTAAELNILDGVTSTAAELNILDGVTSTTAELNILDGVTSTATELNLLDALDRGSILYGNASGVTAVLGQGGDGTVLTSDGTDISWQASTTGDITSVVAGSGMTGGATSGAATLNVIGGNGITANSDDVAITAAQTTVTSVLNAALALGRDADNQIKFGTDDQIVFEVAGGDGVTFKASGEIEATSLDISGDADIDGTLEADAITLGGTALGSLYSPIAGSSSIVTLGTVTTGTWQSSTAVIASAYLDADTAHLSTTQSFTGAKTFGAASQFNSTVTVGANDDGYDVIFYGNTASANATWDTSADDLILSGAAGLVVPDGQLTLGSTAVTSTAAELNILDGVTSTTAELNILDGVTSTAAEINLLDGLDRGSIIYGNASSATTVLGQGGAGTVLTSDGTDISWAAATGGHTIQEEGSGLTQRTKLNFIGAAVTATDDSGNDATKITVTATGASLPLTRSDGSTSDPIALTSAAVGESLVSDTTPQLGGNLDVNGQSIVSDGSNENIPITPHGTGSVVISKADINAGAIDGTAIGAGTPSTIAGTTLSATGDVSFDGGSFVFNEAGANKDFRIEGDAQTHLFSVDASVDEISLKGSTNPNTASGSQVLGIHGEMAFYRQEANAFGRSLTFVKSRGSGVEIVQDDDDMGYISWAGADGVDDGAGEISTLGAQIKARIDGSPASNNIPAALVFSTNSGGASVAERMVITASGMVGIGQPSPSAAFDLVTDGGGASSVAEFFNDGNAANRHGLNVRGGADDASGQTLYLHCYDGDGDQVGYVENNSGTFRLVDGSDERGKEDIVPTTVDGLALLNAIEVKDFTRKKSGDRVTAGFTAQQMQTVYPAAVSQRDAVPAVLYDEDVAAVLYEEGDELPDGKSVGDVKTEAIKEGDVKTEEYTPYMGVSKDSLIGPLVKAVQQLSAKVTALESA